MSLIKVNNSRCKSCYLCTDVCPHGLIKKSEIIGSTGEQIVEFKDDENKCRACAQCALVCPDVAIVEVVRE